MIRKLEEVIKFVNDNSDSIKLSLNNYISTENMIPNFGGVRQATSLPNTKPNTFEPDDILISNIRPYFKKIWFAKFAGKCSNDVLVIRADNAILLPKYLFYWFNTDTFINMYVSSCKGTKMPRGDKNALLSYDINIPSKPTQQHIVNTIGSVDDLIDNYQNRLTKIHNLCDLMISKITKWEPYENISFDKGKEVGSSFYKEIKEKDDIEYFRVGDLLNKKNTVYVHRNDRLSSCVENDILISFDGAPGRVATSLNGYFSSGIRKVVCSFDDKGYIYFSLRNSINQNIIQKHAIGTTILHASNAIPFLVYPIVPHNIKQQFNSMFFDVIELEKKIKKLYNIKTLLLKKYFSTNQ